MFEAKRERMGVGNNRKRKFVSHVCHLLSFFLLHSITRLIFYLLSHTERILHSCHITFFCDYVVPSPAYRSPPLVKFCALCVGFVFVFLFFPIILRCAHIVTRLSLRALIRNASVVVFNVFVNPL